MWYTEWNIDNTGIASISGHDNDSASIYASNPGDTTLTVELFDHFTGASIDTKYVNIHVNQATPSYIPVNGVSISDGECSITLGDHGQLEAWVHPHNATNQDIDWYTSNDDIVEVHGDGAIFANGVGEAWVTARSKDSGDTATCHVYVNEQKKSYVPVDTMGVYPSSMAIGLGQSARIQYQVYPTDASNHNVTIYSDNTMVATVTQDAVVTGQRNGVAHIIFTSEDGNKTAATTVSVSAVPGNLPVPTPAPAPAVANGHDANVQLSYLQKIAATPLRGTCVLESTYPSAYDINVINGMKARSDVTVVAQFPYNGHLTQVIVPSTVDMTRYAVGTYVDWTTLMLHQADGVSVHFVN